MVDELPAPAKKLNSSLSLKCQGRTKAGPSSSRFALVTQWRKQRMLLPVTMTKLFNSCGVPFSEELNKKNAEMIRSQVFLKMFCFQDS